MAIDDEEGGPADRPARRPRKAAAKKAAAKKAGAAKNAVPAKKAVPVKKAASAPVATPAPAATSPVVDIGIDLTEPDGASWWRAAVATLERIVRNLAANWKRTLLCAGVGAALGWLANVFVMAGKYDGFVVPQGSTATGQGNVMRGASFWFVGSMVISAVVNFRINAGSERFWAEVRGFPQTIRNLVRDDGSSAAAHALFGFAGGTLITWTLGPSLSGAVAVGILVAVGTLLRPLLVTGLLVVWRWIVRRVAPRSPNRTPVQAVTVTTLGSAGAMAIAALLDDPTAKLLLGVGAAVGALVLSQRARPSAAVVFAVLGGGIAFAFIAGAEIALADDGGWRECGSSLTNWWNCSGSDRARWLAVYGAGGSGIGAGLGSALLPPTDGAPLKPWYEMTEEEKNRFRQDYIRRFKETHPNASSDQLRRFIEGLDSMPQSWWEKQWDGVKNLWDAYWEDLSSGKQAEGLGGMFYGMGEGVSKAAKSTWNELMQLDNTLAEFGGVFWDDLSSGAQRDRLQGMLDFGGEALSIADQFLADPAAAYEKYGRENVERFMAKMGEFERALANSDPTEIRRKIGEIAGMAEFEVMLGGATDKLGAKALAYLDDVKAANLAVGRLDDIRDLAKHVEVPKLTDDLLFERHNILEMAKRGEVKISAEEAQRLFGIDEAILLERQGTILQTSEGAAEKGMFTQYKLGDENALIANKLRTEHPDIWTGKWNPVGDKSYVPGEEAFMSPEDLARFRDHPPLPGETVNYKPRELTPSEIEALPPELQARYNDRMKDASAWDHYTGFDSRKTIDYSKPENQSKYGPMYVPEDPRNPVKVAEFWKDPADNRVYVRYQTEDGKWSAPLRQASDVDTVTHGGGTNVDYQTSTELQYKQSGGQLGEGDTPAWTRSMLEQTSDGGYQLSDPKMKDMLYKAIDALHKADGQPVIEQTLDGYVVKSASYAELDMAKDAAMKLDASGAWTPQQRAALVGKGILPPK